MTFLRTAAAIAAGLVAALALLEHIPADSLPEGPPAGGTPPASLAALAVAPEDTAHYRRDDWGDWTSRAGCTTRETMLRRAGRDVVTGEGCTVLAGVWVSGYDGVKVTEPGALDIDHVVPQAEVMRSGRVVDGHRVGPRQWDADARERYANDPAVLAVVTARSNRAKGDQDPASWLPQRDRCGYVRDWVRIKHRYRLSVDPAERAALAAVFTRCAGGVRR